MDLKVPSSTPDARSEPRGEWGVGDNVRTLGEECAELGGEGNEPVLRASSSGVEGGQILVVNINP